MLSNGNVSYSRELTAGKFKPETILTYSCNRGYYTLYGRDTRTCQSTGEWNGPGVVCAKGNENLTYNYQACSLIYKGVLSSKALEFYFK